MPADGKQLEGLVAFVEQTMLPAGFKVETNQKIFNDDGVQIAEFDVKIRGKVGTTEIAWLIECRDRPAAGPAPGSWIEQLFGRRSRFGFNKVTAVSTTGFAPGAIAFAQKEGIELREVKALTPEEFRDWLLIRHIEHRENVTRLDHASLLVNKEESDERKQALLEVIASESSGVPLLRNSKTGAKVSTAAAFASAVQEPGNLFDGLAPNGEGRKIRLRVKYANQSDHFVVETKLGPVRIEEIIYLGELSVKERLVPIAITAEYRDAETGNVISQVAAFEPQEMHGMKFSLEMHRMGENGETHIIMRRLANDA